MLPTLLMTTLIVQVFPSIGHRLITDPYSEQQYDSVVVSSDSITIRERKQNDSTPLKPSRVLKPQKRSYEECPENDFACLHENDKSNSRIAGRLLEQYSNARDVKRERNSTDEGTFGKSHWSTVDSQTRRHTNDDTREWVTLDPVPWSTSKISKWHPNKVVSQYETKPWIYESSARPPAQQFWVSESGLHEQRPSSQWGFGTNDIITDDGPSDFPVGPHHGYGNPNQHVLQGMNYLQQEDLYNSQGSFNDRRRPQLTGTPSKQPQNTHPSTHPSNGNGEWVLLSATKGYSFPRRHRWSGIKDLKIGTRPHTSRNMRPVEISKYHEENLTDKPSPEESNLSANRKLDDIAEASSSTKEIEKRKALQILYTGPTKNEEIMTTTRRKVKLQVLPPLEEGSTSHNGVLEVDTGSQTVDEAREEDEKLKNAAVKKGKIRGYKLIPASEFTGKSSNHKNVMALAAVGAGMIPATMALLVPMALGRRRRSLPRPRAPDEFRPGIAAIGRERIREFF